jgi:hypothetical protein
MVELAVRLSLGQVHVANWVRVTGKFTAEL